MKNFISVKKKDGSREHFQKRLVLGNIYELYEKFKMQYTDVKIDFSKFAQLRPHQCVLAGGSGMRTVCGECKSCPDEENIKNHLRIILDDHFIDKVEFQVWQQTDRNTLRTEVAD